MNILSFDTSTEKFSLAIYRKNQIVYYYSRILKKKYSKYLIPIIKDSLIKVNMKIKQINVISISVGPGSFTGIRLGIAAAKGLSMPYNISILGFSNMDLIMESVDNKIKGKNFLILIKGKKNDFYYQLFNSKKRKISNISFFSDYKLPNFKNFKDIIIIGNFNEKIKNKIKSINKKKFLCFKKKFFSARNLIYLSKVSLLKKNIKTVEPIYVYDHYAKNFGN